MFFLNASLGVAISICWDCLVLEVLGCSFDFVSKMCCFFSFAVFGKSRCSFLVNWALMCLCFRLGSVFGLFFRGVCEFYCWVFCVVFCWFVWSSKICHGFSHPSENGQQRSREGLNLKKMRLITNSRLAEVRCRHFLGPVDFSCWERRGFWRFREILG